MSDSNSLASKIEILEHDMTTLDFFLQSLGEALAQSGTQDIDIAKRIAASAHEKVKKILPDLANIRAQLGTKG